MQTQTNTLSQADIARHCGISRQRVSKLRLDGKLPPPDAGIDPPRWSLAKIDAWHNWRRGGRV